MSLTHAKSIFLAAIILIGAFLIASIHLERESLWYDEAWSMWAVRGDRVTDTLSRVREDVHPPLYFLLLDGWTFVAGESAYAVRLLSTLFGMIGLAATYAVGRRLFDRRAALYALVMLATASFFVYYAREVRMYTLVLALAALSTWLYLRWLNTPTGTPTWRRGLIYGLCMSALLYTHYDGVLVIVSQIVHLLLTQIRATDQSPLQNGRRAQHVAPLHKRLVSRIFPYTLAVVSFVPYVPIVLQQFKNNPNGPLAAPVPTDWGTIAALVYVYTSDTWWLFVLPLLIGGVLALKRNGRALVLLVLWLVVTPAALLAINLWFVPIFQIRYTLAALPAGALLVAYGLRYIKWPLLASALLAGIVYTQLTMFPTLWPPKLPYRDVVRAVVAERGALEPAITDIAPINPVAYYDRLYHLRHGVSIDLSWRRHSRNEVRNIVDHVTSAPSVWLMMPTNVAKTWHAAAFLDADYGIAYREGVANMVFYRFDRAAEGDLSFRFGSELEPYALRYDGDLAVQYSVNAGETLCVDVPLVAETAIDGALSAGLHVVHAYNTLVAQRDDGLSYREAGASFTLRPCVDIPADAPLGDDYHLQLVVYTWADTNTLPVMEVSAVDDLAPVWWGDALMLGAVEVTDD
jgi:4-amino-4-deoxy-L-arabinose transferase-like glycosyltransferase